MFFKFFCETFWNRVGIFSVLQIGWCSFEGLRSEVMYEGYDRKMAFKFRVSVHIFTLFMRGNVQEATL